MGRGMAVLLAAGMGCLAGTDPRPKPEEYPASAKAGSIGVGAEYRVRSVSGGGQTWTTKDYLVVEVALYPARGERIEVSHGQFTLRLNGKKNTLLPQAPAFVAAAFKYPDWERRPTVVAEGGMGDVGVIVGRPPATERFPGDPRPRRQRLPAPPRAPEGVPGAEPRETPKPEEVVVECALPEDPAAGPVAGYLYFPFKGKTRSVRAVELLYAGPGGGAVLKLL